MSVRYEKTKEGWIASQKLLTISFYDLEGTFEDAIKHLQKLKEQVKQSWGKHSQVVYDNYNDGTMKKKVCFFSFVIQSGEEFPQLQIWGKRWLLSEEAESIVAQEERNLNDQEKRDAIEYERLQKKFKET